VLNDLKKNKRSTVPYRVVQRETLLPKSKVKSFSARVKNETKIKNEKLTSAWLL